MSRLFHKLLRFLHRRAPSDRMSAGGEASVLGSAGQTPAMVSERPLDAAAYRAALAALPVERRELLELHQIEGLSFIEIAERRGTTAAQVEGEIAAALGHLAISLEGDGRG